MAIKSEKPLFFADLNVFDSDACRIDFTQPPGIQFPSVRSLGGHGAHDHQPIGAT